MMRTELLYWLEALSFWIQIAFNAIFRNDIMKNMINKNYIMLRIILK